MVVNGKELQLDELAAATPAALLEHYALDPRTIAIERNGAILPRQEWQSARFADEDRIELIRFVGGG